MGKIAINIATGSIQQQEYIVGIDLGTTNSLVAIVHPESKKPIVLKEFDNTSLVPSIIHFGEAGRITVGTEARDFVVKEPQNTIFSVKRLMGKSYNDIRDRVSRFTYKVIDDSDDRLVKVQVGNRFYSPIELSSFILKELKSRAEHILKSPVTKAVITVPAYFNDTQRQATRDAGKLAGLDVLRIVNEPTAASLAYGIGMSPEASETVAIYDLGGGTFDISILGISNGIFEVLSTNGDTYLGGDDFDQTLVQLIIQKAGLNEAEVNSDKGFYSELRMLAEDAKKKLSIEKEVVVSFRSQSIRISRTEFEQLIVPIVERTIDCTRKALADAHLKVEDIKEIVMVGGSTRIPFVKDTVKAFFGKEVNDTVHPDEVVALGAAIQADILSGNNKDLLLLDITPLSLGIETMGGLMDVLIPRNSKIPSRASRQYTTQKDGQSGLRVAVFQGERDLVKDNRKLAEFVLSGIPAMPAGLPKIEITFLINADGILTIKAVELRSGVQQIIEVKPQHGLTDQEVEKMLEDSILHAKEDIAARALTEASTEADQLINTTMNFVNKNRPHLTEAELTATENAIVALREALKTTDKDAIQNKTEELNEISRPYAERMMDKAISKAIKGKSIKDSIEP